MMRNYNYVLASEVFHYVIRKELGYVDFSNPITNIYKNVYYTQYVYECCVEQESHFQLAKMLKMNIVKQLRHKYIN